MKINIRVLLDTPLGLIECPWSKISVEEGSNVTIVQPVRLSVDEPPRKLNELEKSDF